jgi:hypothetical protein
MQEGAAMTGLYWDEDDGQEGLLTRRSPEHCLSEQEVEDFLFQRLSGVSREAVEEHLLFCETCRQRVEEEESFIQAMRGAADRLEAEAIAGAQTGGNAPEGARPRFLAPRWAAAAALAVLVVGGTVTLRIMQQPGVAEVKLVAQRAAGSPGESLPREGQSLSLQADLRGLPPLASFRWTIVDATGNLLAEGIAEREEDAARFRLKKGLPPGRHWVRIQDPDTGMLLREFALHIQPKR